MTTRDPAWLSAWREQRVAPVPVPTLEPALVRRTAPKRVQSRTDPQGFAQPRQWPYDGGRRREPVLDYDHSPPRVVRRVGWQRCIKCSRRFFSDDVRAVRMCPACKNVKDQRKPQRW